MNEAKQVTIVRLALLAIVGSCILACSFSIIHIRSTFKAAIPKDVVLAGEPAHFTFWQSDAFEGLLGHACYWSPLDVDGLPSGAEVGGVEWILCHTAHMTVTAQPTTPPGVYQLVVRYDDSLLSGSQRVTLQVIAP